MRVTILGMGRLGASLVVLLKQAGVDAVGWRRGEPIPEGDVFWITVKDHAIEEVAALIKQDALVLHASGSRGTEALAGHPRAGVLHPLMTFPGIEVGIPTLRGIPASIRGEPKAREAARWLCQQLGLLPFEVTGDPRVYHAAAVLASSHLASVFLSASETLAGLGIPLETAREALLPLAQASLERAARRGAAALTGPTVRGDEATILGHQQVLDPEVLAVYEATRKRQLELLGR